MTQPQIWNRITVPKIQWEQIRCNLCGRDDTNVYHRERLPYFNQHLNFTIVQCRHCGLVYTNPRLIDHNATYLYGSDASDHAVEIHSRAKKHVFDSVLHQINRLTRTIRTSRPLRLLDVGSGSGHFLAVAQQAGCRTCGIEPVKDMAEYARSHFKLDIIETDVLQARLEPDSFDVITLWDVLEHVADPKAVLQQCSRWLRPGGLLACRFPSAKWQKIKGNIFHHLLHWDRPAFSPTMHLYFFDAGPFSALAEQAGLDVVKIRTTPLEPNTEHHWLNITKRAVQPMLHLADSLGVHIGNLEVYCRKGAE